MALAAACRADAQVDGLYDVRLKFIEDTPKTCWFGPVMANEIPTRGTYIGGPNLDMPFPERRPDTAMLYVLDEPRNLLAQASYSEVSVLNGVLQPDFRRIGWFVIELPPGVGAGKLAVVEASGGTRTVPVAANQRSVRLLGAPPGELTVRLTSESDVPLADGTFNISLQSAMPVPTFVLRRQASSFPVALAVGSALAVLVAGYAFARSARRRSKQPVS